MGGKIITPPGEFFLIEAMFDPHGPVGQALRAGRLTINPQWRLVPVPAAGGAKDG